MCPQWLIIGISGATCGGKTTIANNLNSIFPNSRVISQDNYFLPVDDDRHIWIPELNHINFDILTSLDMDKMYDDIKEIVTDSLCKTDSSKSKCSESSPLIFSGNLRDLQEKIKQSLAKRNINILVVEGFCIFYHKPIETLCNLKYFVTLNKEECYKRRIKRVYEPPDCPGYFEHCAWPEYLRQLEDIKNTVKNVHYISEFTEDPMKVVLNDLESLLDCVID